jgi:putative peptidoglycan lipid II flippase
MAADGSGRPAAAVPAEGDTGLFARNSVSVVAWTTVSRISGFVRIAVVAAVLGPTYLGNVFQATNNLPMIAYAALTGSLFSSLLVPSLVRHVDTGNRTAASRLAGAFLTAALAAFGVVCGLLILIAPLILRLLAVGVPDPAAADAQRRAGLVLLLLFVPQMLMYAVVGTAEAVMNAHGRFALPAAAPVLENLGIIATMAVTAFVYGTGDRLAEATTGQLLLLGIGTTSAVALHAAVQWWGARSVGVTLLPRLPWRVPELRSILRRAVQSLGFSVVDVVQPLGALIVANRVPGGVIAFQLAYNLYSLPPAMGTRPVAVALLPRLARLAEPRDLGRFRDELNRGAALVAFLIVPAAVAYLVLHDLLAGGVTFGQMATPSGRSLVAACVAALALGLLGYSALLLGTYASYARRDARSPLRAALIRAGVGAAGMGIALQVAPGAGALLALGLAISAADIAGGAWLAAHLRRALPAAGEQRLARPLLRTLVASVLMAGPAYLVGVQLPHLLPGRLDAHLSMVAAAATGAAVYFLLQWWWDSPELALIRSGLRPGGSPPGTPARRAARTPW